VQCLHIGRRADAFFRKPLFRRFEFSQSRQPVPGGKYELANGMVYGVDLGFGR
jgi:hypothetical protein